MLIQWSGVGIVAGSGKLNGTVVARNRGGAYARVKVTPVNPQTTAQQNGRNILSTWSQNWRALTEAQRQGWNSNSENFPYSDRFGNSRKLSGQQLYVKLNANLNYADAPGIDDVPSPVEIPAITSISITASSPTSLSIAFTPSPVPAGFALILRMAGNVGAGKSFVKNLFRNVSVVAPAGTSPFNALVNYEAIFGTLVEGSKIFVQAFLISTTSGQAGIPIQTSAVVPT